MGQKNGLYAFGYNSILMKSWTVWAKCWGLALADFGRDPRSSDSLRGRQILFSGSVNDVRFHRFPSKNFTTFQHKSIGNAVKTFVQNFENFTIRGGFSKQNPQKLLTKFPGLATIGHHNSAVITDAENSLPYDPPTSF